MSGVSLFQNASELQSLLPQYAAAVCEKHEKNLLSEQDLKVLYLYAQYIKAHCYVEAYTLFDKISCIEQNGPIFETAQKIQKAIQPVVHLCAEGKERIEWAKTDPVKGPKASHWLAMYLNDLSMAAHQKDQNAIKIAIQQIKYVQGEIAKMPCSSELTTQLNAICEEKMNQADPDQLIRNEVTTWSGYLKARISDYFLPSYVGVTLTSSVYCFGLNSTISSLGLWMSLGMSAIPLLEDVATILAMQKNSLFPKQDLALIKDLTVAEKEKLAPIQKEIRSVAHTLQMPESLDCSIEIKKKLSPFSTRGCMFTRAVLSLSEEVFNDYESTFSEKWRELLREVPDHPVDLGRFLDQVDPEKRREIQKLAVLHPGAMDQKQMRGVFAHELGHLQFHDSLSYTTPIWLLQACLGFLILYADVAKCPLGNALLLCGLRLLTVKASDILLSPFSQYREIRADCQTNVSPEYTEGNLFGFKQYLVSYLARAQYKEGAIFSCEEKVRDMLTSFDLGDSHPNLAKRLLNSIEQKGKPYEPPSQFFSTATIALVAGTYLALLATDFYQLSCSMDEFL